jgi:glycine/D-amino acid oxidase-like deaminating enzyme
VYQFLSRDETRERVNVAGALGGLYAPASARVQPAALAAGIAAAAERRGVEIYEATPVSLIEPAGSGQPGAVARTKFGDVRARSVLRCTEGYTAALPGLRRALLPMNSHMVVTEPLDSAAWQEIGWAACETLSDEAHAYMYAQRTAAVDHLGMTDQSTVAALTGVLRRLFPAAAGAQISHAWCGVLGVPRDWCASVTYHPASGMGWAGGYTGHGVAAANLAGRTLADLVTGERSSLTTLPWVGHRSRAWEPEPARWAGVHGLYALYRLADRLESPVPGDTADDSRVRIGEALGRVGDVISGIPH